MISVEVEAVEDRSRAEGGHALILLRGVEAIPATGRFKLSPVDLDGLPPESRTLADAEFTPTMVTLTEDGLALFVGPDVTEHPALVPGIALTLDMVDLEASGNFLWPAVTPIARPKRRNIMTRRVAGDPLPARVTAPEPANAAPPKDEPLPPAVPADPRPAPAPASTEAPVREMERQPTRRILVKTAPSAPLRSADHTETDLTPLPTVVESDRPETLRPQPPAASTGHRQGLNGLKPSSAAADAAVTPERAQPPAEPAPRATAPSSETEPPSVRQADPQLPPTAPAAVPSSPATTAVPLPSALVPAPASRRPRPVASAAGVALVTAAVVLAGQLLALRTFDLRIMKRPAIDATVVTAGMEPAAERPPFMPQVRSGEAGRSIYDVIVAGPRSPRGVPGDGVSPAKAIQTAHTLLHGPTADRDPEEAIYWLKRYLGGTAGAEHSRIALTQLGSAYAEPGRGERDFASARLAWELASALGDPVAMCFLGAMHEHGLGVSQAEAAASVWYERAAAAGRSCATTGERQDANTRN